MTIPINLFDVFLINQGLFGIGSGVTNGTGTAGNFLPARGNWLVPGDGESGQAVVFGSSSPNAFISGSSNDTIIQFGAQRDIGWTRDDTSGWGENVLTMKHAKITKFNSGTSMDAWMHANMGDVDIKLSTSTSSSFYLAGDTNLGGWINFSANGGTLTYDAGANRLVCSSSLAVGSRAGLQSPLPFDADQLNSNQLLYIKNFKALESPEAGAGSGSSFFIVFYDNGNLSPSELAFISGNTNAPIGLFRLNPPTPYGSQALNLQLPDYRDEQDLWIYYNNQLNEVTVFSNYSGQPRAVYQGPLTQSGTVVSVSMVIYAGRTVGRSHGIQFEALYHMYLQ